MYLVLGKCHLLGEFMSIPHNPLKQYFRRPAIYITLPSKGKFYEPGVINQTETGELPVYPMTAIDDITSKTPDALFNGSAVVELIKSCIPDIKEPWKINSIDMDAVLIAIRSASNGNDMEIETMCPACSEESKYNVNLVGILSSLKAGNYNDELLINDLYIKFKPLTYREMNQVNLSQFELQKMFANIESLQDPTERANKTKEALSMITSVTMKVLASTIEYIKTPSAIVDNAEFILDFLENCDKIAYNAIKEYHEKIKEDAELKPLKIKCIHCQHEYEKSFTLNVSDFFG